ncbi:unnamed protein product, partial [Mesorhabditis belari]|uniref:IBR domain-containing protein n=1 Tax=Mesorhabditis belari TaxID=2138241 RepID=A0AAF3FVC2_9BILA
MSMKKNQQVPEFNDMEFPELAVTQKEAMATRRAAGKGKWHAADRSLRREAAVRAVITKTVHQSEVDHQLGKRRLARLISESGDGLAVEVPYSMNRKARWASALAESLLAYEQPEGAEVTVVEAIQTRANDLATAVHRLNEDGSVTTARANGYTAKTETLRGNASKKRREAKRSARNSRNEPPAELNAESEEEQTPALRIDYTIQRTHVNPRAAMKKAQKIYNRERIIRRAGAFRVDPDDLENGSEMEASIHDDSDIYKPSRDFRFSLADYMSTQVNGIEMVRRASVEATTILDAELEDALRDQDHQLLKISLSAQNNDIVDISKIAQIESFFEAFDLSTIEWKDFHFINQIDSLPKDFPTRWLDADRRRVMMDLTKMITKDEPIEKPLLMVVLEKTRRNHIRIIVNSTMTPSKAFEKDALKDLLSAEGSKGLLSVLQTIGTQVGEWKKDLGLKPSSPSFISRRVLHSTSANSRHLSNVAHTIDHYSMAELLRKENELATDTFERLSSDEWSECDDEEFESVNPIKPVTVKCNSCECSDPAELFEMDDSWECRECLRVQILSQIRSNQLPLQLSLVCAAGQSPYDVLACLLPLPLINFYTRIAATEVLKDSGSAIGELTECPGCAHLAHIDRPNETSSCVCSSCGVLWCVSCGFEPHWPMDCAQRAAWVEKFDKQYSCDTMKDQIDKFIRRITCECGVVIEVGDLVTQAECAMCRLEFDPRTMTLLKPQFQYDSKARKGNYHAKSMPFYHKKVELIQPTQLISKQYSEVATWARGERLSEVKVNTFEKMIRKWDSKEVDRAREARKTLLHLLENGTAWLYLNKKEQGVRVALNALQKQFSEFTLEAERLRVPCDERLHELEISIGNTIDAFKAALQPPKHNKDD